MHEIEQKRRLENKLREGGLKKALDEHKGELEMARIDAETELKDQFEKARRNRLQDPTGRVVPLDLLSQSFWRNY